MPSDQIMRDLVKKAYPTRQWAERVNKMPNHQVAAVYLRLLNQKKI